MARQHREFPFDPYAINDNFAVNASSSMLQNDRALLLHQLEDFDGTDEKKLEKRQTRNLDQIRNLVDALR